MHDIFKGLKYPFGAMGILSVIGPYFFGDVEIKTICNGYRDRRVCIVVASAPIISNSLQLT